MSFRTKTARQTSEHVHTKKHMFTRVTVLQNNYQNGRNVDDYWSLSTLESGWQSDECESCLSQTRHETYTSVTLGAVGIIIVLVVSFVFFLHFSSNPSQPGIKDFSPLGVALLGMLLRTMSAPAQYVQDNGSKLGTHFCGLLHWMCSLVQNIECTSWICARQWHTS